MLANHTYRLVGGPMDGDVRTIREGARELHVEAPDDGAIRLLGTYRVERHPTHGYVLRWHNARTYRPQG